MFKNIQAVSSFNPLTFHNPEAIDVALYESHRHQKNGGIIAVASYGAVGNFARYLALLCSRDLGTTIAGANITVLAALLIIINGHYEIKKLVIVIFSRTKEKRT